MSQAYLNIFPFFSLFQFPMSSIEPALQKLKKQESKAKELRNVFIAADDEQRKMVDYNTFR